MRTISIFAILVLFFFACGPSVESESKSWTANLKKMEKLKEQYPAYKALIESKIEKANAVWEQTTDLTDEKEKAKKMAEANNFFETGEIYKLTNLKSAINEIKGLQKQLSELSISEADRQRAETARQNSTNAVTIAEQVFAETSNLSVEQATIKINNAYNKIESATTELKGIIKVVKDKIAKEQKTTDSTKTTTDKDGTTTNKKDEVIKVKCEYCGSMNKTSDTKCSSCGAPIENK